MSFQDGRQETLRPRQDLACTHVNSGRILGTSIIAYAREAIALGLATEEHGALFKNGATPSGVLRTEKSSRYGAFKNLKTQFSDDYQGLDNSHKPMILEMGLDWKPINKCRRQSVFRNT